MAKKRAAVKETPKKRHALGPGPGRPKGVPNKATIEIKAIARGLLEDEAYRVSLRRRLLAGKASRVETLLYHYAYGVPKQSVEIEAKGDLNLSLGGDINARLATYDEVLSKLARIGAAGSSEDDNPRKPVDPKGTD